MEIGNKILELRKKNNLSQEDLAEQVGVARQTISKWELGETSPDIKQANVGDKTYHIEIGPDGYFNSSGLTSEMKDEIIDLVNFDNPEETEMNIQKYFMELREEQKSE